MPFAEFGDLRTRYEITGDKEPALVLSNSLGTDLSMWDPQMTSFAQRFRILRYDTRGHGQSSATPGDYTIAQLGQDVLDLLDTLKIDRVHFCGLSMGGMIGIWLGNPRAGQIANTSTLQHGRSHRHQRNVECPHRKSPHRGHEAGRGRSHRALVHTGVSCGPSRTSCQSANDARNHATSGLFCVLRRHPRYGSTRRGCPNQNSDSDRVWRQGSGNHPC